MSPLPVQVRLYYYHHRLEFGGVYMSRAVCLHWHVPKPLRKSVDMASKRLIVHNGMSVRLSSADDFHLEREKVMVRINQQ